MQAELRQGESLLRYWIMSEFIMLLSADWLDISDALLRQQEEVIGSKRRYLLVELCLIKKGK